METIKSKYAVFSSNTKHIYLYNNDDFSISPLYDYAFENVTITFNDNNSITLEGDERQYSLSLEDFNPSKSEHKIHPSSITQTHFRKRDVVCSGWYRLMNNVHKKLIINNYIIEE